MQMLRSLMLAAKGSSARCEESEVRSEECEVRS